MASSSGEESATGAVGRGPKWEVLSSRLVLHNDWASVRRDACRLPNGTVIPDYYYWEGNDFALVFALDEDGLVLLVQQYKHAVREVVIELPAGMVDQGETPREAAERELLEETGYEGADWSPLGVVHPSAAKSTVLGHGFLVRRARRVSIPRGDAQESIQVLRWSISRLVEAISADEIRDASSAAICFRALSALEMW